MTENPFKYSYKTQTSSSVGLSVYNSGFQMCEGGHSWGPGMRDHYLIHHVASGKGTYTVGSQTYQIAAGDTFLVYPSTLVSYQADSKEPWEYYWVGFNGNQAAFLINQTDFTLESPVIHTDFGESLRRELYAVYEAHGSARHNIANMTGHLYLALGLLIEASSAPYSVTQGQLYVDNAIRFISHNYSRRIDVSDIAHNVGISRSNLFRAFLKYAMMSPNQYLTLFRVNMACDLLLEGKLSVSQVASSVGYEDQMYFSRVFKKIKGVSPRAFMLSHMQDKKNSG